MNEPRDNPMQHPSEQPSGTEGSPKFGRLLIALALAVLLIIAITLVSESLYS